MTLKSTWNVYIIETSSGKLYTGITNNLKKRFFDHLNTKKGARFFHFSSPKKIVFCQPQANRSEASKKEYAIKKMDRLEKLLIIDSNQNQIKSYYDSENQTSPT
jgi:putative endonuclease